EQAAAEGITSLVASGDEGGAGCDYQDTFGDVIALGPAVNGLASTPYNVAVGGTEFVEGGASGTFWSGANDGSLSSALGYIPEKVWNESCDETVTYCPPYYVSTIAASGGGQSSCAVQDDAGNCVSGYTKPTWQAGVGVPPDGVRDVPDLSLAAAGGHDGYVLCFEGSCTTEVIDGKTYITSFAEVGGTSAATPAFAGILSLIEQKNGTFLGQINPTLYQLFAASDPSKCNSLTMADPTVASSCLFYDITTGSNATPQEGGEHATTGYDMATGIGSVNAANLLNAWASAAKLATTTTVSVNPTSFTHGQNIAVAVQVAPQSGTGTPSGDVSLQSDQYGAGGYVTLANGAANTSVATLPGGTYNLTANYAGDSVYAASTSAPIPVTVTPEDSVLTLSSFTQTASGNLLNPPVASSVVAYGSYLGLQVQVAGKSQQGTPSGSVSFYDNGQLLGALKLDTAAQATLNTGYAPVAPVSAPLYLSVGTHSITVSYSGDNSFNAAKTSAPYTVTVTKASAINYATSTTQYYVAVGTPITVTAIPYYTWTGAVGTAPVAPTGTMQFTVNNQPIGDPQPISVSSENQGEVPVPEAVLTYAFTTPGQGVFGAIYSGDSNYSAENTANSNGYQVYFQVHSSTLKTPSVTVVANPASPKLGDVVNYTITVHPDKSGDPAPTGTVSIYGAGVEYFTSIYESYPLVNGVATFATTAFQAGNAVTYASYSGDTNYSTGASSAITVPISKAVPAVTLTTPAAYVGINAQTTLHASVIGDAVGAVVQEAALSGAVLFYDAVNGAPAQQLGIAHPLLSGGYTLPTTLPAGTNVITVQYLGDVNWIATTSNPVTIQVSNPDYQLTSGTATVALSAGGSVSVPLTVTPLLGYDLPVTLSCGSGLPAGVSCSFSPAVLTPNGGAVSTTLTLVSDGAYTVASNSWRTGSGVVLSFTALSLLLVAGRSRRKRWARFALAGVVAAGVGALSGCGSDSPKLVSMTLATSSPKVNAGQSVTFTANLSSGDKAATGTVTFLDGSSTLSSQNVSSNAASYSSTALALGTHTITAHYSGDKDHNATSAGPVYQAISGSTSLSVTATDGSNVHTLPLTLNLQ
ncbi:MAG: Ig-like domain repeat protein, partial [Acidobacteriaceae bacterium]|nr:Ig-like domain repeat protein [Acidobacteriaceae bacterium]